MTGASRGIGLAVARALLDAGACVAICSKDAVGLESAAGALSQGVGQGRVLSRACDVSDPSQVAELIAAVVARFGGLDVLVNNAGVCHRGPVDALTPAQWAETIATNLTGAFLCSREAIPHLERRRGFVLNMSSRSGINAFPGGAAYCASKFGMVGLSEAMTLELRPRGIRVCCLMPGRVNTDFGDEQPEAWHLRTEDVARAALHVLTYDERALVSRIELRPDRPPS